MSHVNKKLAAVAAATALMAAIGASVAQTTNDQVDPMATPQQVDVNAANTGEHIYFFRDQGNSPETDPAAHLMLIKHEQPVPVAERSTTTTTTTVAQSTPPADTMSTTPTTMPAASDTSNTDTSAAPAPAPVDTAPPLAPKADRN